MLFGRKNRFNKSDKNEPAGFEVEGFEVEGFEVEGFEVSGFHCTPLLPNVTFDVDLPRKTYYPFNSKATSFSRRCEQSFTCIN